MRVVFPTNDLAVTTGALEPVPLIGTDAWIRERLAQGGFTAPALVERATRTGWPAVVAAGSLTGTPAIRVFYRFLDLGAFAELTGTGDVEAAWHVLGEARPAYDELASLEQLFR